MPLYIYKNMENFAAAMEQYVTETLRQGLYGWQVTDCTVSLIRSQYSVPDGPPSTRGPLSSPQDFRKLTPLVVMAALKQAGTVVCEPVHWFRLDTPADTLNVLLPVLAKLHAVPEVSATKDVLVHPGGRHPGDQGARAAPADPAPHPGRRRHGIIFRPLRAGPRPGPRPGREPTTTPSTARNTCTASSGTFPGHYAMTRGERIGLP